LIRPTPTVGAVGESPTHRAQARQGCTATRPDLDAPSKSGGQDAHPTALLPRPAADKVRERDAGMIVLDHGQAAGTEPDATTSEDDAYYAQFKVPDDLMW
jgi:hypothetical protein